MLHRAGGAGWRARFAAVLLLGAATCALAQPTVTPTSVEHLVYALTINGRPIGETVLLKVDGTRLLARAEDWDRWRLVRPDTEYRYQDEAWFALDQAPGFTIAVDAPRQEARLEFAAQAFGANVLRARPDRYVKATPPPGLGGFLNYELFAVRTEPQAGIATSNVSGLLETGVFNPQGVFTSQWLGKNLGDDQHLPGDVPRRAVRLDTAVTRDDPASMETLRLGDGVGATGLWGSPVRNGGVRWSRNFSTQPGFVTIPQPTLRGETALPSVIDVYVDGLRRGSLQAPPGPFVVENLPTMTGQGEVQVVVRDLLGREQVLSDNYISGVRQLRAGLHDFSYEAGFEREQYGIASDEYGDFFAAGTHRHGFTDEFTGEARVELSGEDTLTAGLGGIVALPGFAVISNAVAISHGDAGYGVLDVLTVQHDSRRGWTVGAKLQTASDDYRQLGLAPGLSMPRRTFGANFGTFVPRLGRFGLSYLNRDEADPLVDSEAVTATFATSVRRANLTLLAIDRKQPTQEYVMGLTLSVPFGARNSASTGFRQREAANGDGSSQSYARMQRNLSEQEDWGYRLLAQRNEYEHAASTSSAEAGLGVNGPYGSYGVEAATFEDLEVYRASLSGGLGTLGGHSFASRKLSRSFAVVETGAEDIELLVNNRLAGRTNADGIAILPQLQPYQANAVRVDATNVPLDVEVPAGEFQATPYYRSGVLVPLNVRRSRSALLTLLKADGTEVPAGASVRLRATGAEAPVGRKGQAYLTGLNPGENAIEVRWNGTQCAITFNLPADAGVQPQLGPYTCR